LLTSFRRATALACICIVSIGCADDAGEEPVPSGFDELLGLGELAEGKRLANSLGEELRFLVLSKEIARISSPRGASAELSDGVLTLYGDSDDLVVAIHRWFRPTELSFDSAVSRLGATAAVRPVCSTIEGPDGFMLRLAEAQGDSVRMLIYERVDDAAEGLAVALGDVGRFVPATEDFTRSESRRCPT